MTTFLAAAPAWAHLWIPPDDIKHGAHVKIYFHTVLHVIRDKVLTAAGTLLL